MIASEFALTIGESGINALSVMKAYERFSGRDKGVSNDL
jgi:hypothetical protein